MANDFTQFLSGTLFGSMLGQRSKNNKYTSQPDFVYAPFDLRPREQWVTINENENFIYNTTPELKMVVDRLALMFANGTWEHLDQNGEKVESSQYVALLEDPNVFQSRNEFLFQWWIQRAIYGNTFMFQLKGSQLQELPTALWNLSPSRMTVERTGKIWRQTELDQMISGYCFKMKGENQKDENFEPGQIIQFSMPDSDDPLLGRSPLESIRMPLSNIRAAYGYRNVILTKKGAIGVWSSDAKDTMGSIQLTTEEKDELEKQLVKTYGLGDHQNSVAISTKALKWNPSSYPTKDLMLFEEIDADKKAIIDTYGANENMFSNPQGSTFNNVEMGERHAYQDTIIPTADDFANGLSKRWGLLEKGQTLRLSFEHIPLLQEDQAQKSEIIKRKAEAAKILKEIDGFSMDEIRRLLDWGEL